MADNARFSMYRGDTKILSIAVTDGSGLPVTVDTAQRVVFGLFDPADNDPVLVKQLGDGITVAGNVITVTLAAAETALLSGSYPFECEVVDVAGYTSTVLRGTATVSADLITPESVP